LPPVPVAARPWSIERAVQPVIAATILMFVLASGSIQSWIPLARRLRWAGLLVLAVLALVWAWQRRDSRVALPAFVAAGGFLALAALSIGWSAAPRETIGRAIAFAVVLLAAGALAWAVNGRPEGAERVLEAVVAGAALVAAGGLLVLLFRHDRAVQAATTSLPARYQGLGGGPNTATMLFAVALPAAAHVALDAGSRARHVAGWVVSLGLLASIVASGSRGALVGGSAGLAAYAALREPNVRRAAAGVGAVAALFLACVGIASIPDPAPAGTAVAEVPADPAPAAVTAVPPYVDANGILRLQDDVGHPPPGVTVDDRGRPLTSSSGRTEAWRGALKQAADRPLFGYGFGTEESVFVDRYVGFNSNVPENSYVGLALELGTVGLVLFLALAGALLVPALRRRPDDARTRSLTAACAGVLVAGLVLGVFQSYLYAPGNNATAALWICAFLLVALRPRTDGARVD
jgi:O-Antigen ligase